jgi:hypothetical protein
VTVRTEGNDTSDFHVGRKEVMEGDVDEMHRSIFHLPKCERITVGLDEFLGLIRFAA